MSDINWNLINEIQNGIEVELQNALEKHGPFHSAHEGYCVILEEMDELWDEVKKKTSQRDKANMEQEATQIAAMCIRFIIDICRK